MTSGPFPAVHSTCESQGSYELHSVHTYMAPTMLCQHGSCCASYYDEAHRAFCTSGHCSHQRTRFSYCRQATPAAWVRSWQKDCAWASGMCPRGAALEAGQERQEPARGGLLHTGCVENELGLRQFLEERGHTYIVTDDKEGPDCELERHLPDADIVSPRGHLQRHSLCYDSTSSPVPAVTCVPAGPLRIRHARPVAASKPSPCTSHDDLHLLQTCMQGCCCGAGCSLLLRACLACRTLGERACLCIHICCADRRAHVRVLPASWLNHAGMPLEPRSSRPPSGRRTSRRSALQRRPS